MPLQIVIYKDQQSAEEIQGLGDWAVISITDPDWYPAKLKDGWHDILRLEFHDIDLYTEPYVLFNQQQARDIIRFVGNCHDAGVNGVVVHCKAGISRSAAVAKWIAVHYNLAFPDGYNLYNKHVYQVLREQGFARFESEEGNA